MNAYNLKKPRRDIMLIAAAGPFMNIILTFAIFIIIRVLEFSGYFQPTSSKIHFGIYRFLNEAALISVFLAAFNMLPLFPLDGFSVLNGLLPKRVSIQFSKLAPYGMPILMCLIFVPIFLRINGPLIYLGKISYYILDIIAKIVGVR